MTQRRVKPRMLEWYRADRSARMERVLVRASAFVVVGAIVGAAAIRYGLALGLVSLGLVVSGGATAMAGLRRELIEERWLALRTDGLVYARDGKTRRMPWRFVDDVRVEGRRVVVVLRSGKRVEITERFAGTTRAHLVENIARARARSAHGLL